MPHSRRPQATSSKAAICNRSYRPGDVEFAADCGNLKGNIIVLPRYLLVFGPDLMTPEMNTTPHIQDDVVSRERQGQAKRAEEAPRINRTAMVRGGDARSLFDLRLELAQDFVIGGYLRSPRGLDALLIGLYRDEALYFSAAVRTRLVDEFQRELLVHERELFSQLRRLQDPVCPFINLPETTKGRFGQGLTEDKMSLCTWVRPELVGHFRFLAWTPADHLKHPNFIELRKRDPRTVSRE